MNKAPSGGRPRSDRGGAARIRMLRPLLLGHPVMLKGITAWPGALAGPAAADHPAAMALFSRAMSAGFVAGVGFRPENLLIRLLFSARVLARRDPGGLAHGRLIT